MEATYPELAREQRLDYPRPMRVDQSSQDEEHQDPPGPVLHRLHHSQRDRDRLHRPAPGADAEGVQDEGRE